MLPCKHCGPWLTSSRCQKVRVLVVFAHMAAFITPVAHRQTLRTFDFRQHLSTKVYIGCNYSRSQPSTIARSCLQTPYDQKRDLPLNAHSSTSSSTAAHQPMFVYHLMRHGNRWPTLKRMRQMQELEGVFQVQSANLEAQLLLHTR